MKAEIRADGTLLVTAETELESYALRHWTEDSSWGVDVDFNLPAHGPEGDIMIKTRQFEEGS